MLNLGEEFIVMDKYEFLIKKLTEIRYKKWYFKKRNEKNADLERNEIFRNIHSGKRCFIIGNGPSTKKQDFSLLKDEIVFTVNAMPRNPEFKKLFSNYHVIIDKALFDDSYYSRHPHQKETILNINTDNNKPICFFNYDGKEYCEKQGWNKQLNIYYISQMLSFVDGFEFTRKIDFDYTKCAFGLYSVVQLAIGIAIYMGFKEIYLLGCDATEIKAFIDLEEGKKAVNNYSYKSEENEIDRVRNCEVFINNGIGHLTYEKLLEYCQIRNIKLVNCTAGGILNELPREDFETVVCRKNM